MQALHPGHRMAILGTSYGHPGPTVGASCGHPRWPWGRGPTGPSYGHPWGPWGPWGHRMAIRGGIVWPSVGASYGHPWRHRMAIRGGRGGRGGIV
eukprot:gene15374-biopygen3234